MTPPDYRPQVDPVPDGISTVGGTNLYGKPFVHVHVDGKPYGQLTPGAAVTFGLRVITAAIEAERDSAVVRAMLSEGDGDAEAHRAAGAMLTLIRSHRDQWDPDAPVSWRAPDAAE